MKCHTTTKSALLNIILNLFVFASTSLIANAAPATVPNTFTAGTPVKAADVNANFQALVDAINAKIAVGTVIAFAGPVCPTGTVLANGSAVSRTTYATLFAAIGTSHGSGDGATTFNLPDYRGRFLRGVDGGAGNDPDRASRTAMNPGGNIGDLVGSLQADDFKSHSHGGAVANAGSSFLAGGAVYGVNFATLTAPAGGNETRPKNANVNFCIYN